MSILAPADTCVAPVATVPELVESEQFAARRSIVDATSPAGDAFRQLGWVLAGQDRDQPGPVVRDAAITDTESLLRGAGLDADEIALLTKEGAIA